MNEQNKGLPKDIQVGEISFLIHIGKDLHKTAVETAEAIYKADYRKKIVGEWKQTTEPLGAHNVDCVECSACGESWVLDEEFDFDVVNDFWHFCPNCGAKMGGDTNNG